MRLSRIAADMRHAASQQPGRVFVRKLRRGLRLSVERKGTRFVLRAARIGVFPSAEESGIVATAFCVPAGVLPIEFVGAQWDGLCWDWAEAISRPQSLYRQLALIGEEIK